MPADSFTDGLVLQGRRVTHLAVLRLGLTLGYLCIEGAGALAGEASVSAIAGAFVVCYSTGLLPTRGTIDMATTITRAERKSSAQVMLLISWPMMRLFWML